LSYKIFEKPLPSLKVFSFKKIFGGGMHKYIDRRLVEDGNDGTKYRGENKIK